MTNNQPVIPQQKIGTYNLNDGKIRINYESGTESVLFEDVSSLSWKACSRPNNVYYLLMIPGFLCLGLMETSLPLAFGGCIAFFILAYYMVAKNPIKWDDVVIETRGGKIISFSVDSNKGKEVMEKIEEDKRNHVK